MTTHSHTELFSVCPQCGELVVPTDNSRVSYFDIFKIPLSYFIDLNQLQNRFYELSRILHPDRYQTKSSENLAKATHWFAFLTTALEVLKSQDERAKYIFELAHFNLPQEKSSLPPALAEEYFDLQETLETSNPDQNLLKNFSTKLQQQISSADEIQTEAFKKWEENSRPLDESSTPYFLKASKAIQQKSYLKSMALDLEKKWH